MTSAQIGPITGVVEAFAAAVGAGAVLWSVAAGVRGLMRGSSRVELERGALSAGYMGGAVGGVLALADLALRYLLMR